MMLRGLIMGVGLGSGSWGGASVQGLKWIAPSVAVAHKMVFLTISFLKLCSLFLFMIKYKLELSYVFFFWVLIC